MAFTGCSSDPEVAPEVEKPETVTMTIVTSDKIENAPLTRTHYDETTKRIHWDEDGSTEVIYVLEQDNVATGKPKESQSSNCAVTNGKASFTVTFPTNLSTDLTYAAVYPAGNYVTDNQNLDKVKVSIPSAQTPAANSFDPAADLMATMPVAQISQPQTLSFRFGRIVALGKMTITNLGTAADETVKTVSFSAANKILTGRSYFNVTTGRIVEIGYYAPSDKITLDLSTLSGIDPTSFPAWFTCYPTSLTAGDTFTVVVTTSVNKTYTKQVTLSGVQSLAFTSGDITTFSIDMTGIVGETSASSTNIATLTYDEVKDLGLAYGSPKEYTNAGGTWIVQAYKPTQAPFGMQLNDNSAGKDSHIKFPAFSKPISSVMVEVAKAGTKLTLYAANNTASQQYATLVPVVGTNTFTISEEFTTAYLKATGSNIITSVTVTSGAAIRIADIENLAAVGATNATATYKPISFTGEDDTAVTAFDGTVVTTASVDNSIKTLTYTVSPNYTGTAREGSITLSSINNETSITIKVLQLTDIFEAAPTSVILGGDIGATAEFTLTSDFTVNTPAVSTPDKFSVSGPVGNVYTVTALADGGAAEAELGTITFTRSGDSKTLVIPVSQKEKGGSAVVWQNETFENYIPPAATSYQASGTFTGITTGTPTWTYTKCGNPNQANTDKGNIPNASSNNYVAIGKDGKLSVIIPGGITTLKFKALSTQASAKAEIKVSGAVIQTISIGKNSTTDNKDFEVTDIDCQGNDATIEFSVTANRLTVGDVSWLPAN